jgi:hypothetical protein
MGKTKNFKGANGTKMVKGPDGKIVDNIAGVDGFPGPTVLVKSDTVECDDLPERVIVSKTITYDVTKVISDLKESGNLTPTLDDVLDYIGTLTEEDFSCGWGHTADTGDLVFSDENGTEL